MKFEEARNMIDSKYNIVSDLGDAWAFTWKEAENMDGGDQGFIVIKDSGEIMRPYQYYFKDAVISIDKDE